MTEVTISNEPKKDFNDLVLEQVMFETPDKVREILKRMFPDSSVNVFVDRGNNTHITVDTVYLKIEPTH